jgi:hypothetical protein
MLALQLYVNPKVVGLAAGVSVIITILGKFLKRLF